MTQICLALGSNVGDSQGYIEQAITELTGQLHAVTCGPLYRTTAVGFTDQSDFINTAVTAETDLSASDLLVLVKSIEAKIGRISRFRWGPREIDIDIIFYGSSVIESDILTIPHPQFTNRAFVLCPLADLNDSLIDPVSGLAVKQLVARLSPEQLSGLTKLTQPDISATITD